MELYVLLLVSTLSCLSTVSSCVADCSPSLQVRTGAPPCAICAMPQPCRRTRLLRRAMTHSNAFHDGDFNGMLCAHFKDCRNEGTHSVLILNRPHFICAAGACAAEAVAARL
eukprot:COSAG06_NODE_1636_length_8851_cov_6.653451_7_plen_112_part_00